MLTCRPYSIVVKVSSPVRSAKKEVILQNSLFLFMQLIFVTGKCKYGERRQPVIYIIISLANTFL